MVSEIPADPCYIILSGHEYDQYSQHIADQRHTVLVYDAGASEILAAQLKTLVHTADDITIAATEKAFTGSLTGLTLHTPVTATVFESAAAFVPLIALGQYPLLMKQNNLFLLASTEILDMDTPAAKDCEPHRDFFSALIPFVLFIKWAFKDHCWHLNTYTACITVDDPLLQPTYGFIEFEKFHTWLKQHHLAATFAFIPWNYRRSSPQVIDLFRQNAERLSICVHGCDHTRSEFAATDKARLTTLATTALVRMVQHQAKYGLQHDSIMIFPQGKFSHEARQVIGALGFRADVSSGVFATNYQASLTIRDILAGAVTTGAALPLYRRRYPVDVFDFACDLLFEKPLIITQHHDDFKAGYAPLQAFTQQLQALEPTLTWLPLGKLVTQTYWQKTEADGTVMQRQLMADTPLTPVINRDDILHYGWRERVKVAARRYLSEFRDNVVQKNTLLKKLVRLLRRK